MKITRRGGGRAWGPRRRPANTMRRVSHEEKVTQLPFRSEPNNPPVPPPPAQQQPHAHRLGNVKYFRENRLQFVMTMISKWQEKFRIATPSQLVRMTFSIDQFHKGLALVMRYPSCAPFQFNHKLGKFVRGSTRHKVLWMLATSITAAWCLIVLWNAAHHFLRLHNNMGSKQFSTETIGTVGISISCLIWSIFMLMYGWKMETCYQANKSILGLHREYSVTRLNGVWAMEADHFLHTLHNLVLMFVCLVVPLAFVTVCWTVTSHERGFSLLHNSILCCGNGAGGTKCGLLLESTCLAVDIAVTGSGLLSTGSAMFFFGYQALVLVAILRMESDYPSFGLEDRLRFYQKLQYAASAFIAELVNPLLLPMVQTLMVGGIVLCNCVVIHEFQHPSIGLVPTMFALIISCGGLILGYTIMKGCASIHGTSKAFLGKLSEECGLRRNSQEMRRILRYMIPIHVTIGKFYRFDEGAPLAFFDTIVANTASWILLF